MPLSSDRTMDESGGPAPGEIEAGGDPVRLDGSRPRAVVALQIVMRGEKEDAIAA
jgi:hypothetical protein